MAASRTALVLLGLVVLAAMGAEAYTEPAAHTCERCPSDFMGLLELRIALEVDLSACLLPLDVMVGGVVGIGRGEALTVIAGGEVTTLGPLHVHLEAGGLLDVMFVLRAKHDKTRVVAKVALHVPVAHAAVALVDDVYLLRIEVVLDPLRGELVFFTGKVRLHSINIRAHIHLLGRFSIEVGVGTPPP